MNLLFPIPHPSTDSLPFELISPGSPSSSAGKHVLCEKPLTLHMKQTEELLESAKSKGVFFMEGIWSRCFPIYRLIREEIAKGSIGEVAAGNESRGQMGTKGTC